MKKPSFRPLLTATAAACLLPAAAFAQIQMPGGLGESTAIPATQSVGVPMGTSMAVPVSPSASISQPYSPVSSAYDPDREGFRFRGMAGVAHDSNVTRANTNETSDTITQLGLGMRFNKRYGLQRVVLDAEYDHYSFNKLDSSYGTLNYAAAWQWAVGNLFDGVASADRRQFRDITVNGGGSNVINRRTENNDLLEGRYKFGASWRALAGVQHNDAKSSNPANSWDGDPSVNSARVGLQYEAATGSTITGRYRHGTGSYKVGGISDFTDSEAELAMIWVTSPKTTVEGRIAQLKREHDNAPGRDFDGPVGGVSVGWDITAKTRLLTGYAHDLGSYLGGTGGHNESDRFYVTPTWRATEQTAFNFRYEHENRKWVDVTGGSLDVGRTDKYDVYALGAEWQPRRNIGVTAQYRNEKRSSAVELFNYRANVIGLAVKLTL